MPEMAFLASARRLHSLLMHARMLCIEACSHVRRRTRAARAPQYAFALWRSLRAAGSDMPLVAMVTADVTEEAIATLLRLAGPDGRDAHAPTMLKSSTEVLVDAGLDVGDERSASSDGIGNHTYDSRRRHSHARRLNGTLSAREGGSGLLVIERIARVAYPTRYRVTKDNDETRKSLRFTKLEAWRMTRYAKIVLIDTDTFVLRNIDGLFTCPAGTAVADAGAPGHFKCDGAPLSPPLALCCSPSNDTRARTHHYTSTVHAARHTTTLARYASGATRSALNRDVHPLLPRQRLTLIHVCRCRRLLTCRSRG